MGLFDDEFKKYKKMLEGKPEKKPDVWETDINESTGLPEYFYLNGKEIFDSDNARSSPSGNYIIHIGWHKNDYEAIALTTRKQVLKVKRTEESIADTLVTDDGIGYAISEEGTLYTLTQEKNSQKRMSPDEWTEARLLTKTFCCVIYEGDSEYDNDDNEIMIGYLKTVILETGATWKKKIRYKGDRIKIFTWAIKTAGENIEITAPDQTIHCFTANGVQL